MLTRIDLKNFKCFTVLKLPLKPLTLLAGTNASGKSTVLQALVLLHQTMREHEWSSRLLLNGASVQLGTAGDVIDQLHGHRACEIGLMESDTTWCEWEFQGDRDDMALTVHSGRGESSGHAWELTGSDPLRSLFPQVSEPHPQIELLIERLSTLGYLTAERLGPRETYSLQGPGQMPVVGPKGEYAVSLLHNGRDSNVLQQLTIREVPPTLLRQVEAHMERFFPACELTLEKIPRFNGVTLGVRTSRSTDFHRPTHTGFGLTQVLPIIVAALSAPKNGLLLIENPEVHLHPAGQATMGEFLTEVAAAGVQVLLETHSDHVLNGIRRAVKNNVLSPGNAALHFFRPRLEADAQGIPQVESPMLDASGNVDSWPDGFFDQFDKDMNHFAGWS